MESKVVIVPPGKIYDFVDGKFRDDTPEEYVRQNIEKRLVIEHGYPKEQIAVEFTIRTGSKRPRADIVIFHDKENRAQENIKIIIECKKEKTEPTQKKDGVGQLQAYMSSCPNCEWGMWTNGRQRFVYRKVVNEKGRIEFEEPNDIPSVDGSLENIERPKRTTLKRSVEDNLLFAFKTCHNHIYANDGLQKSEAFFELLKVIFCKIFDEHNIGHPLEFYAKSKERANPDGQLVIAGRIGRIFDAVKAQYPQIFEAADKIKLKPRSLAYIVSELQSYSFLGTDVDIKGKAYEEIVGSNLRGDRGEFFTPRNVVRMAVGMLEPTVDERVLDPACGTGGFLVVAMNYVGDVLRQAFEEELGKTQKEWSDTEKDTFARKIRQVAEENFIGFDLSTTLVKATKMNMVMNNDGNVNIFQCHSLLSPHEWEAHLREGVSKVLGIRASDIRNADTIGFFDVVMTNPPFGSEIPIRDATILSQYDLGYIWEEDKEHPGAWRRTDRLQSSVPPEQLFIERCVQFLRPGGRMGIVLPDSILGNPGLAYIRHWLIRNTIILASIDLHVDTFQPKNGTQTSVLFLQKKTDEQVRKEERTGKMRDYPIFMAMVDKVGHDKRGNKTYKRDKYGNEILEDDESSGEVETAANGTQVIRYKAKKRIEDDQMPLVVEAFRQWRKQEGISW
ncbi:MAG TPA: N-6 DNA methylase [bacterium]|nr:N-6 DNA methylase [bacterium]